MQEQFEHSIKVGVREITEKFLNAGLVYIHDFWREKTKNVYCILVLWCFMDGAVITDVVFVFFLV